MIYVRMKLLESINTSYSRVGGIECVQDGTCEVAGDFGLAMEQMQELCYLCNQCEQFDPFM